MAEKKIKWTEQQRRAILARGSDVLVTASAGTGKTAVLSGRCVDIVSDESVCPDVWSILVLTFTDMAAEQMRSRIAEQLRAAFAENTDEHLRGHLRRQLMLLQGADISTIHSFCKRLITEYFYKLGLDPTFGIMDEDEQRLLKSEVLEKTIDWAWQQSNLRAALEQLFRRRDLRTGDGFLSKIIALSDFLDGIVWRENWCEQAALLADAVSPLTSELGKKQKEIVAARLGQILNQLRYAQKLYNGSGVSGDWAQKLEQTHIKPVERCAELLAAGDWDKFSSAIKEFPKPATYKPRGLDEDIGGLIQNTARKAVEGIGRLSALAILNPDYLDIMARAVSLQTKVLIELIKKFDQIYSEAKRAVNCLDFADLEHYALKLLADENSTEEKLLPSETALALREKYKYIFVDEYQDINAVQQAILDLVSGEDNVFVVGDVKQSIYAWRGAEPGIFLERLRPASVEQASAIEGLRVDLNANFRSAKGILDFVNEIFSRIMTSSFAKIDYDESAKLRPASEGRSSGKPVVEFHILDEQSEEVDLQDEGRDEFSDGDGTDAFSFRQRQAAMIAQRIQKMVGAQTGKAEFEVYDKQKGTNRPVEYRDIVILMRSLAKRANDYVEILRLAGVPVSCQATAGYFETTEITDCLCLLKVLDNPQRDIELAAVLRSPFFKVSDTELAKMKVHSETKEQYKNFYECVLEYSTCGADIKLAEKVKKAFEQIERWRSVARRGNLAELIWQIYRQTGFLSFVSALPSGQARRANLLKLHDRAIQFEGFASSGGIPSLRRFVEFIEKLQETGQDWAPAEPEAAAGNAVRILSVHKSKGLEFPVVFLAELNTHFNKRDIQAEVLADAANTLGLQVVDRQSNTKLSSIAHQIIAEQKESEVLAEEMRILYVAMTRARQRLILSASEKRKRCRNIICDGFFLGDGPVADWALRRCRNPLEWVLYGLSARKNLHNIFETGLAREGNGEDLFSVKLYGGSELGQLSGYIRRLRDSKSARFKTTAKALRSRPEDMKLLSQVKESLSWRYQFGDVSLLPAKQSVTQLTHRSDEYFVFDYSRALERLPKAVLLTEAAETVDGRLIGTATHLLIAKLDLGRAVTKEAIEKTKEKLLADGTITEAVAEHINAASIMGFFESELGKAALDDKNTVHREWPFAFALPASSIAHRTSHKSRVTGDETIVVQGIIDMLIRTPCGLVLIDFKTDDVDAQEVSDRADVYRKQLQLYGRAAEVILNSKVLGRWLYFLTPSCAFEIK